VQPQKDAGDGDGRSWCSTPTWHLGLQPSAAPEEQRRRGVKPAQQRGKHQLRSHASGRRGGVNEVESEGESVVGRAAAGPRRNAAVNW
jgi:hypothetical protein